MNYDSTISDKVNLSRVLDEMVMDGTELETIVQFLKNHEKDIPDIYTHSAFVYDLYDFGAHPYRFDTFLVEHIEDLRPIDFFFAVNSLAMFLKSTGASDSLLGELKERYHGTEDLVKFSRAGWDGIREEEKFHRCGMGLVEWLNGISDQRDFRNIISHSYFAMSAFQASTFVHLNPAAQFALLRMLQECVAEVGYNHYRAMWFEIGMKYDVLGEMLCSLLRQLLFLNLVDLFNWTVDVMQFNGRYCPTAVLQEAVKHSLSNVIPKSLLDMVDGSGIECEGHEQTSYEEVVFEMNLLETKFEPCDLFLYIYLGHDHMLMGMRENKELLEFFSLPFDWDELAWLKDGHKVEKRNSPF